MVISSPTEFLKTMFLNAVACAAPLKIVAKHLPKNPKAKNIYVIGAGKASAAMAKALENYWQDYTFSGVVVTRYGHNVPCHKIKIIEASHPIPDENGQKASNAIIEIIKKATKDDLIIGLFSGGGSALLSFPFAGIDFLEKQDITKQLLKSGADITAINCVRKHLSAVKGGRLAAMSLAPMINLFISDVTGNDLSVIASGATVPDKTTCKDALNIISEYKMNVSSNIITMLEQGILETPKPNNPCFNTVTNKIIASPLASLKAASLIAKKEGIKVLNLGDYIEGEAKDVAKVMAGIAFSIKFNQTPIKPPCVIISGGETSVTLKGKGRGGRNAEFLLNLGANIIKQPNVIKSIYALACDTDGIDGSEDNAGAIWTPETSKKALLDKNLLAESIKNNDSYGFFQKMGALIITKPTLTNVNDFRAIYIDSN